MPKQKDSFTITFSDRSEGIVKCLKCGNEATYKEPKHDRNFPTMEEIKKHEATAKSGFEKAFWHLLPQLMKELLEAEKIPFGVKEKK